MNFTCVVMFLITFHNHYAFEIIYIPAIGGPPAVERFTAAWKKPQAILTNDGPTHSKTSSGKGAQNVASRIPIVTNTTTR